MAVDSELVSGTINEWMLDYACYSAWQEYRSQRTVDSNTDRDFLQVVIQMADSAQERIQRKMNFLLMLCHLADGENYLMKYEPAQEGTVLEVLLDLVKDLPTDSLPNADMTKFQLLIKAEAVYVPCREGDFNLAHEVKKRLFRTKLSQGEKRKLHDLLEKIIDEEDMDNPVLKKNSYSSFTDKAIQYLSLVFEKFPQPYLVKAAQRELEKQEKVEEVSSGLPSGVGSGDATAMDTSSSSTAQDDDTSGVEVCAGCIQGSATDGGDAKLSTKHKKELFVKLHRIRHSYRIKYAEQAESSRKKKSRSYSEKEKGEDENVEGVKENTNTAGPSGVVEKKTRDVSMSEEEPTPPRTIPDLPQKRRFRRSLIGVFNDNGMHKIRHANRDIVKPRSRFPWTTEETETFFKALQKYGVGRWAEIKDACPESERNNVQLKDKWRTLIKTGEYEALKKKFGPVK